MKDIYVKIKGGLNHGGNIRSGPSVPGSIGRP